MEELKPCPFCGGKAEMNYSGNVYRVRCQNEECYGHHFSGAVSMYTFGAVRYADADTAARYWNTRAERTCHIDGVRGGGFCESVVYYLSCGHVADMAK